MIHVKHSWLALGIMTALAGCMSEGGDNDGTTGGDIMNGSGSSGGGTTGPGNGGSTAGTGNGGSTGAASNGGSNDGNGSGGQTGGSPTTGGTTGPGTTGGTDPDGGATGGGTTGYIVPPSECGADASGKPKDTSAQGGCYYFYCYTNEAGLKASATPGGTCANDKDLAITCEGESARTVSQCARQNAALAVNAEAFRKAVTDCARKNAKLNDLSEGCLGCNVESAVCAAGKCISQCIAGDSPDCDKCRQDQGCTPNFYTCGGLVDPMTLP